MNGNHDIFLPGAPFGRATFIFHVPADTRRLLVSPANRAGEIRFEIERIESLPLPYVFAIAATRSLAGALHAYGAALIGRYADMRYLLRNALSVQDLKSFPDWFKRGKRPFEPTFDGERPVGDLHVRILVTTTEVEKNNCLAIVDDLIADLGKVPGKNWSVAVLAPSSSGVEFQTRSEKVRYFCLSADNEALFGDLDPNDLVAEVPAGTRLHENAIAMIVAAAKAFPAAHLFYGDNDHIDEAGAPFRPIIRSGFDPLLLQHHDYIGSSAIWRVGAVRSLRPSAATRRLPNPAKASIGQSLSRFIFRFPGSFPTMDSRIRSFDEARLSSAPIPSAAILIPTRDRLDLLRSCIESLLQKTAGEFRIVILDNESREVETIAYFEKIRLDPRVTIKPIAGAFNFSHICNEGAKSVTDEILIFLNNDTLVIDGDWLIKLVSAAIRPDVGAVGLKLLYPNGRVQHAGVIGGLFGRAGHFNLGIKGDDAGFFGRSNHPHRLLAVTGACLAVMRDRFLAVGGFDELHLPIDLNDIDLCFRLDKQGWGTVQLGDCRMYHYESASRGHARNTEIIYAVEQRYFSETWVSLIRDDPYFSPNLTLYSTRGLLG